VLLSVAPTPKVMQLPVAHRVVKFATVCSMKNWKAWPERAKEAKDRSEKTDAELSAAVTDITGRTAGRAQVNHWFTGTREPTISQFMALCGEIGADPGYVLFGVPVLPDAVKGSRAAVAMKANPTENPDYLMTEKRLRMRKKGRTIKTVSKRARARQTV